MPIVLVQLTDIHFKSDRHSNPLLSRVDKIADAVLTELTACAPVACALIYSGDFAFSGKQDEFAIALEFAEKLEQAIKDRMPGVEIQTVAAPGNHDCDFSGDQSARDILLDSLRSGENVPPSILGMAIGPLKSYFSFSKKLVGDAKSFSSETPFFLRYQCKLLGKTMSVMILNTAWMASRNQEATGKMLFPWEQIVTPETDERDFDITIMHHPSNWFQDESMRGIDSRVETTSDLIITGHEHFAKTYQKTDDDGTDSYYVEGGVLQESDKPDVSSFNIIRLDFDDAKRIATRFSWSPRSGLYERSSSHPHELRRKKHDRNFQFSDGFGTVLDDLGELITHPYQSDLKLSHLFIYPDLREIEGHHLRGNFKRIKSEHVVDRMTNLKRALVTGTEKAGKTCLSKKLVSDLRARGFVPLRLDGSDLPKSGKDDTTHKHIEKCFLAQYHATKFDKFEQLPIEKRVAVLDDFHKSPANRLVRKNLLESLERRFGVVIVIGADEFCFNELGADDKAEESGLTKYTYFEILEFGQTLREREARKWLTLGRSTPPDDTEFEEQVRQACNAINDVIRQHRLPCSPLFVIVLLQQACSSSQPLLRSGSYGYLYEAMVTAILGRAALKNVDIPSKYSYLAEFAFKLFTDNKASLSEAEMRRWHIQYIQEFGLPFEFTDMRDHFAKLGMLRTDDGQISFRYKYNYCFFLARYLSKNIHDDSVKQIVRALCGKLHHQESADVVVFLAHMQSDPIVLQFMNETADRLFAGAPPVKLEEEVQPLNKLSLTASTLILPNSQPEERRRNLQESRDEALAADRSSHSDGRQVNPNGADAGIEPDPNYRYILEINAGFRTIDILGQVLRNSAGETKAPIKEAIIDRIYKLARRMLGSFMGNLEGAIPSWIEQVKREVQREDANIAPQELLTEINKSIFGLCQLASFATIKRASLAVGMEILSETYDKLLEKDPVFVNKMFRLSIKLDRPGSVPADEAIQLFESQKKNPFCQYLVSLLVWHHLYLYHVREEVIQRICAKLEIGVAKKVHDEGIKRLGSSKA